MILRSAAPGLVFLHLLLPSLRSTSFSSLIGYSCSVPRKESLGSCKGHEGPTSKPSSRVTKRIPVPWDQLKKYPKEEECLEGVMVGRHKRHQQKIKGLMSCTSNDPFRPGPPKGEWLETGGGGLYLTSPPTSSSCLLSPFSDLRSAPALATLCFAPVKRTAPWRMARVLRTSEGYSC